jgi:hypothetical protein
MVLNVFPLKLLNLRAHALIVVAVLEVNLEEGSIVQHRLDHLFVWMPLVRSQRVQHPFIQLDDSPDVEETSLDFLIAQDTLTFCFHHQQRVDCLDILEVDLLRLNQFIVDTCAVPIRLEKPYVKFPKQYIKLEY